MSFGSRLRDKRKELGITQPQLAELLGVSQSAIGSWETDVNSPRATILYDLFKILHCDANYLLQDETRELYKNEATPEEMENLVKKYRDLDDHGKTHINTILEWELQRTIAFREQVAALDAKDLRIAKLEQPEKREQQVTRLASYFLQRVSAGTGSPLSDDMVETTIEIPDNDYTSNADFVIGVNGDSMEPTYHDGDKLLVQQQDAIEVGQIGVFIVNNESFVKELGINELISHNKIYQNIKLHEDDTIRCAGRVIGKLED